MSSFPISLFAMLSVAACAPMAQETNPPDAPEASSDAAVEGPEPPGITRLPDGECSAEPAQRYVGQKADGDMVQAAMTASGAKQVRVVEPGMMVTMDFRSDRLTIHLDESAKIASISCG